MLCVPSLARKIAKLLFLVSLFAWAQEIPVMKTIELEWEGLEEANGYEVRLTPVKGGDKLTFKTYDPMLVTQVPTGVYRLQIRSKARVDGTLSPWSDPIPLEVLSQELHPLKPANESTIAAEKQKKLSVEFEWTPVEKAKLYTLKVWTEGRKDKPWIFKSKETKRKLSVPTADVYYWQVTFDSSNRVNYFQEPTVFTFNILGPKLIKPTIEPIKSSTQVDQLTWKASPQAKSYKGKLLFKHWDETKWQTLKEGKLEALHWPQENLKPGLYKLELQAQAPRRTPSDVAEYEFHVKPPSPDLAALLGVNL